MLLMVSVPVAAVAVAGRYPNTRFNVAPGFSVAGRAPETIENPVPLIESELTVTADVPVEVRVRVCVAVVPTVTLPKLMLEALTLSVETAGTISQIARLNLSEVGALSPTVTVVPLVGVKLLVRCDQ